MAREVESESFSELRTDIGRDWSEVEHTRVLCRDFLEKRGIAPDLIDAVSMVSAEMLENALKYGVDDASLQRIEYRLYLGNKDITVEVTNLLSLESWKHLQRLDFTVQWIRGFQNPFEAYVKQLKEVSEEAFYNRDSRLGLVRMAYEGQSILDFYIDQDGVLNVSAVFQK